MRPVLKNEWVVRIFAKLRGVYGAQFKAKYSNIHDGIDVGMNDALSAWGEELGMFGDRPEAIAYALDNLPTDHAPNAIEFKTLCKAAPRAVAAISYVPEYADPIKVAEITQRAVASISDSRDHMGWAKDPKTQIALDVVVSGSRTDARLKEILNSLVSNGICTEEFKLIPYEKRMEAA